MRAFIKIGVQTVMVIGVSAALALLVNGMRKGGLPLVPPFPPEYRCPSQLTEGRAISVKEALRRHGQDGVIFVDARLKTSYDHSHIANAINLPYSFLEAVPPEAVDRLRSYRWVVVYCNTESMERSRLMAGELSEAGLQNIYYLEGGFLEWVKTGGLHTGKTPLGYEQG